MANEIVLDGEVSLDIPIEGVAGIVIEVGHDTGIDTIVFNPDYTLTFNMTNGETFTTGSIRGEQGQTGAKGDAGDDYVLTQADKEEIAGLVDTPVDDVQIDGTSILNNGVANIPIPNAFTFGVVKVTGSGNDGITLNSNKQLRIYPISSADAKTGTAQYRPITPMRQHESAFYGLAKVAGHDEKDSTLPVGTYTEDAKTAIRTMLGLQDVYDDYSSALEALGVI